MTERPDRVLLVEAEVSRAAEQTQFAGIERRGAGVDNAADRVRTVERRAGALQHFHAGKHFKRDRQIEIEVARLHVIHAEAVEQDEGLPERSAANGDVGLQRAGRALLQIECGVELEQIEPGIEQLGLLLRQTDHADVTVRFGERQWLSGAGDDDGFL